MKSILFHQASIWMKHCRRRIFLQRLLMASHRALVPVFVGSLAALILVLECPFPAFSQSHDPALVEPSQPELKRHMRPLAPKVRKVIPDEIVIKYTAQFLHPQHPVLDADSTLVAEGEKLRKRFNAESISTDPDLGWIIMKLPPGLLFTSVVDELAKDTRIEYVTPDYAHSLNGPTTDHQMTGFKSEKGPDSISTTKDTPWLNF